MLNPEYIRDPETLRRFVDTVAAFRAHVLPLSRKYGLTDETAAVLFMTSALGEATEALTVAADAIADAMPRTSGDTGADDDDDEPWKRP